MLGYRTNTVSDWEAGRRAPGGAEFLRVCTQLGVDVPAAFERFHPATAPLIVEGSEYTPDRWLRVLRWPVIRIAVDAVYAAWAWLRYRHRYGPTGTIDDAT